MVRHKPATGDKEKSAKSYAVANSISVDRVPAGQNLRLVMALGCELPTDLEASFIAVLLPRSDLGTHGFGLCCGLSQTESFVPDRGAVS